MTSSAPATPTVVTALTKQKENTNSPLRSIGEQGVIAVDRHCCCTVTVVVLRSLQQYYGHFSSCMVILAVVWSLQQLYGHCSSFMVIVIVVRSKKQLYGHCGRYVFIVISSSCTVIVVEEQSLQQSYLVVIRSLKYQKAVMIVGTKSKLIYTLYSVQSKLYT